MSDPGWLSQEQIYTEKANELERIRTENARLKEQLRSLEEKAGNEYAIVCHFKEQIEEVQSEYESLTRFCERFGDLSCCYDASDVTRVILNWVENHQEQLSAAKMQIIELKQQLRIHE
jgi:predicted nuclease with TOPRIM domain